MTTDFSNWTEETTRMIVFTDKAPANLVGRKLPIYDTRGNLIMRFDAKIELSTLLVVHSGDKEYNKFELPTINDLVADGIVEEWYPYKKATIGNVPVKNGRINVANLVKECKKLGFNVTPEAIKHNFLAWKADLKSGYCDEANGYHLFSPCGCNPFHLHISELHPGCSEWQKTYEC